MNTEEKFTYKDEDYVIYLDIINGDTVVTMSKSQLAGIQILNKTYIYQPNIKYLWTSTELLTAIPPEVDNGLMLYMQNGGFADLTPVEYLRSLGFICSTSTQP